MTSTDDALDLLAGLTDHVGLWWDTATQIQREDARAMLDLAGPRRHWIGRAKGYSKSRDAAGVSTVALLRQMTTGSMGYVAASDADQAGLIRQSIASFVNNTPALQKEIVVEAKRVIAPRRGTELIILAADSAGSHGLRPSWLVVDELCNWPDTERHREFFDSIWAGLPKVADSRGVIISTAGSPGHFSHRIFESAQDDPLWRVSDVEGPPPWVDPAEVESERRRMFPARFARLWQNLWTNADDSIAEPADVEAACVLQGPLPPEEGLRYICTLDLGVRNDRTVAVIAHPVREGDGTRVVVDRLQVWTPRPDAPVHVDEVRLWLAEFCRLYHAPLHYDPSQAYLLVEQLRRAGVSCHEFIFGTSSVGKLATAIMQALRGRLLTLPDDQELKSEILNVRLRETSPNVLRIDHKSGAHDDRVIAVAMAVYELTSGAPASRMIFPLSDEEFAAQQAALNRRLAGEKVPAPAQHGHMFSGDFRMDPSISGNYDDPEPPGQGQPSPFV